MPGVDEVLARFLWLQSILIRLDLPTLERPMKAYSGLVSFGHMLTVGLEMEYSEFLISILFLFFAAKVQNIPEKTLSLPAK